MSCSVANFMSKSNNLIPFQFTLTSYVTNSSISCSLRVILMIGFMIASKKRIIYGAVRMPL